MESVYRNSQFTLATVAASTCHDGFLQSRAKHPEADFDFAVDGQPGLQGHFTVYFSGRRANYDEFTMDVMDCAWIRRGWTFQERYLAPRLLFFGKQMLHFECSTLRFTENAPDVVFDREIHWYQLLASCGKDQLRELYRWWCNFIQEYSWRDLTYQDDRLPALSGLAKDMYSCLRRLGPADPTYAAGIWRTDFHQGLLWFNFSLSRDVISKPLNALGGPSWSWATHDGDIGFGLTLHKLRPACNIVSVSTTAVGPDPMGKLLSGEIRLSGRLQHFSEFKLGGTTGCEKAGFLEHVEEGEQRLVELCLDQGSRAEAVSIISKFGLWLLLVAFADHDSTSSYTKCNGLVLLPVQAAGTSQLNVYQRVGLFRGDDSCVPVVERWPQHEVVIA